MARKNPDSTSRAESGSINLRKFEAVASGMKITGSRCIPDTNFQLIALFIGMTCEAEFIGRRGTSGRHGGIGIPEHIRLPARMGLVAGEAEDDGI